MGDDIKIDQNEIDWEDVDCIHLDRDQWWAVVNAVMSHRFPSKRQEIS
jgi:hypothetical protein